MGFGLRFTTATLVYMTHSAVVSRFEKALPLRTREKGGRRERPPFPSRFIVPDRSSPSRVRFAASRPGLLRADPKGMAVYEGKGGGWSWLLGCGPCERAEREPFDHTRRVENWDGSGSTSPRTTLSARPGS